MATTSTARDLPAVAPSVDSAVRDPLTRQREELQRLLGFVGDGLDAAVTWRQLRDGGWASMLANWRRGGTPPGSLTPPSGDGGGGTTEPEEPDLTPAPDPTGLAAVGGFTYVTLTWDAPIYPQGHGHARTVIYGVQRPIPDPDPPPVFGDAAVVWTVEGSSTITSIPSDANVHWHLWIKWVTVDGVASVNPDGGLNGAEAETGQDVSQLLEILTGQITAAQLWHELSDRIDLIDGPDTLPGSVAAQILAEATIRADGDSDTLDAAQAYVATYAYSVAETDAAISALGTILTAAYTAADGTTYSAAVATSASALAGLDGAVHALYTVRVQATASGRTVVGGFGLAATPGASGGPEIEFGVRADRFYIGATSSATGVADIVPFVVQTTDQTVNGVLIPKGVYMDAAFIKNLSALVARLGAAWIDNAMIANVGANKLTAGSIAVGEYIQSTGYNPGVDGFRITGSGSAEFNNIIARGSIYAQAADIQGTLVAAQITSNGLSVRRSDGTVVLNADGDSPPWVVGGEAIGGAISLTAPASDDNTIAIRSLEAGNGIDLSITTAGAVRIASKSSDDYAIRLAADTSTSSTTVSDVGGMLVPLEPNATYRIEGTLIYRSAASTTGLKFGGSLPSTATGAIRATANTSQTGGETHVLYLPTGGGTQTVTFSGTWAAQPGSPSTFSSTADTILTFEGVITTGASAGSFQLAFGSEVSSSTVTIKAGSVLLLERPIVESSATVFSLAGTPGFASTYEAVAASFGGPASASRRITLDELGGWTVTTPAGTGSGTPTSGSWSSPTGTGAGDQWQVWFETVSSGGVASISNGAPSYVALSSARSYTASVASNGGVPLAADVVRVAIHMRNVASGAETTLATIDLDLESETT